jgi:Recombinase zinc beta ribbon domain
MNAVCKTKRGSSAPGEEALEVPETWITVEAPHLRIVDEALWEAAHRRLDVTRARYARLTAGKLVGPPDPTQESPHLLTGFVRCARCGGGVSAQRVSTRKRTTRSYCVCTTFRVRGPALCARGFRARLQDLDAAILDRIGRDVLSEDVLMDAAQTAAERHAASQNSHAGPDRPHAIARELGHVQARIGRLVDAYEEGALGLDELKARRGPLDTRRATLEAEPTPWPVRPCALPPSTWARSGVGSTSGTRCCGRRPTSLAGCCGCCSRNRSPSSAPPRAFGSGAASPMPRSSSGP